MKLSPLHYPQKAGTYLLSVEAHIGEGDHLELPSANYHYNLHKKQHIDFYPQLEYLTEQLH